MFGQHYRATRDLKTLATAPSSRAPSLHIAPLGSSRRRERSWTKRLSALTELGLRLSEAIASHGWQKDAMTCSQRGMKAMGHFFGAGGKTPTFLSLWLSRLKASRGWKEVLIDSESHSWKIPVDRRGSLSSIQSASTNYPLSILPPRPRITWLVRSSGREVGGRALGPEQEEATRKEQEDRAALHSTFLLLFPAFSVFIFSTRFLCCFGDEYVRISCFLLFYNSIKSWRPMFYDNTCYMHVMCTYIRQK